MRAEFTKQDEQSEDSTDAQSTAATDGSSSTPASTASRDDRGEPRPGAKKAVANKHRTQVWTCRRGSPEDSAGLGQCHHACGQAGKIPAVDADGQTDPMTARASTLASKQAVKTLQGPSDNRAATKASARNAMQSMEAPDSVVDGLVV